MKNIDIGQLNFKPVTIDEWQNFELFFSKFDQFKGCWCMYWRLKRVDFNKQFGEGNKNSMKKLIAKGQIPGILGFFEGTPIAWCSVGPRDDYSVLNRSPALKKIDEEEVWSIVCLCVAKEFRGQGLTKELIKAAINFAKSKGAKIIEAYPIMPELSKNPKLEAYTGFHSTFEKLGFKTIIQRSKIRSIMRYYLSSEK